jgi:transposase InsO family protein
VLFDQGIESKHSPPYHPRTWGKVERFHQTLKRNLESQMLAESLAHVDCSSAPSAPTPTEQRPHRSVDCRAPAQAVPDVPDDDLAEIARALLLAIGEDPFGSP